MDWSFFDLLIGLWFSILFLPYFYISEVLLPFRTIDLLNRSVVSLKSPKGVWFRGLSMNGPREAHSNRVYHS